MTLPSAIIEVNQVTKTYQGFSLDRKESGIALWVKNVFQLTANRARTIRALDDISFRIEPGEIFGIYGANGAGKTTLIKLLSGLLLPDSGVLQVNGFTGIHQIKDQISYISTNGWMGLEWQLTVHENLVLYGTIFGISPSRLHTRCRAVTALFGMEDAKDKHISELSAGMRQKVTLMRGFLLDRPILYLDEPTVSLDVQSSIALRQVLVDVARQEGTTIIITSHNPVDLSICQRIMLLHAGRALAINTEYGLARSLIEMAVLHLTCGSLRNGSSTEAATVGDLQEALLQIDAVRKSEVSEANGRRNTWHIDLLVDREDHATGEVIDWFIAHEIPILNMHRVAPSLQEVYTHYVKGETTSGERA